MIISIFISFHWVLTNKIREKILPCVEKGFNGNDNWSMTQTLGFPDTANASANISVAMPANSMIYLHLTKLDGFDEPNQQILPR